jgi:formamidopyrimidine-DNA glycosylase
MRSQSSSGVSGEAGVSGHSHVRRKVRPCLGCGTPIARPSYDTSAAMFCATCVERPDDPVTAEHYWDLGGNE